MSSSSNNNLLSADERSPVHSKKLLDTSPIVRKSISRNNMASSNNLHSNHSPTSTSRALHKNSTDAQLLQKQLTVETAVFPEHQSNLFHNTPNDSHSLTKKSSSTPLIAPNATAATGDARSVVSGSESTRSISNNNNKRKKKANIASSFVNPTDIFAQNLSDAVMDADDSDDLESYVYRDKPNPSYTVPPWTYNTNDHMLDHSYYDRHYSSTGTESNTDGCDYNNTKEKFFSSRRPVLRSTVSEIRPTSSSSLSNKNGKKLRPSYKYQASSYYYGVAPTSDDEFTPLVRSRPPRRRKGSSNHGSHFGSSCCRACFTLLFVLLGSAFSLCFVWLLIAIYASPLTDVEVVGISNVLGTQKELIFNLQVRARNSNWWTIRMTNTAFSVFASSHYVPTTIMSLDNNTHHNDTVSTYSGSNITSFGADPAEFLGTIYHLEDPLIYQSGGLFNPVLSTATSQIQIRNPGSTKDDNSGNERWSLLIRYPYELTVRGVLKYQILPYLPTLTQLHSVRVCKMSRIDPATGKISDDVTIPKKSICDDPSPVEGSKINHFS
ncbi:hypothetical protein HMPREF1544_03658 [Mucor circinelloides 1006PhL]|uniref:Uncharacterized protein n=1 Tax=Mucor circinelloides f. circinelloides (strain 1006PhL) TaxID=1220926 RepID=S2JI51_MUCC1|nr:hypothetical protein HMPREF1544_03658 [Mucor circinelloides 1006PhL]